MVMGLGLGLWDNQRRFNPVASLLPGASVLAVYDPSDMATLFQDRAGTVPVTAAGQLVGRILDKGPGGFHRTAMTDAARATYARHPAGVGVKNIASGSADVSNNAVWVASETNNGVTITKTATGSDVNGPWVEYSVVGTASAVSLCNPYVSSVYSRALAASGQTWTASFIARIVSGTPLPPVSGVRAEIIGETAPSTFTENTTGSVYQSNTEGIVSISRTLSVGATNQVRGNINIRTDTGATVNYVVRIQALQVEQGSTRTAYQPFPVGGIRQLFGNSRWAGFSAGPIVSAVSSEGVEINRNIAAGSPSAEIVAVGTDTVGEWVDVRVFGTNTSGATRFYNIVDSAAVPFAVGESLRVSVDLQIISNTGANTPQTWLFTSFRDAALTPLSGGNLLVTPTATMTRYSGVVGVAPATTTQITSKGMYLAVQNGWTVDFTLRIRRIQAERGTVETAYQASRFASADITEEGQPSVWSLIYSGSHAYSTATITPGVDKAQVFAGVRKQSDAGRAMLVEGSGATGVFGLELPASAAPNLQFGHQGANGLRFSNALSGAQYASPVNLVVTGLSDFAAPTVQVRANGTAQSVNVSATGGGNYAASPLFFGGRSGTSLFFTGREYGTIVRFSSANLDAGLIARTERSWIAPRTGVVI